MRDLNILIRRRLREKTKQMTKPLAVLTGANGMDAKSLAHILLAKGYKVIFTYRRNTSFDINVHRSLFLDEINNGGEINYVLCDITDKNSINEALRNTINKHGQINECYLLAAQSHVGYSFSAPEATLMATGVSVFYFLDWFYNNSLHTKVFFAATSELFGGRHEEPCNEESEFDCRSPYSVAKEMATRWVKYYRQLGLFCCYAITYNHSNCYRSMDFFVRRVTNYAAKIFLGKENKLLLGNLQFSRDESWACFVCEKFWNILQLITPQDFILATGATHMGIEYLNLAFKYFNLNWENFVEIDESRFRPNEVIKLVGDSRKAQMILDWKPNRMSFKNHIELMCKYDFELESGLLNPKRPNVFELYP